MSQIQPDPDAALEVTLDGVTYNLEAGGFTGADDLAIYRQVGLTIGDIFAGRITLFTIAALVWRHRVGRGEDVSFAQVNQQMTFKALDTVADDKDADKDGDDEEDAAGQGGGSPEG